MSNVVRTISQAVEKVAVKINSGCYVDLPAFSSEIPALLLALLALRSPGMVSF
jgi:hypothetical protein